MINRLLLSAVLVFASLAACASENASEVTYEAGVNYDLINPPLRTADADKIEVVEFFWYGCGHCYNFEPMLGQGK